MWKSPVRGAPVARVVMIAVLGLALSGPACADPPAPSVAPSARATSSTAPADAITQGAPRGMLSDVAEPLHYALSLTVQPDKPTFSGEVAIRTQLNARVEGLYLHGRDLNVSHASVMTAEGARVRADFRQLTGDGVAWVSFARPIDAGEITLEFAWEAPFDERLLGLHRVVEEGRAYAFTQFESIYARRAFVSFDEPRFKTPYDVTLTVDAQHEAIFNTEQVATLDAPDGMRRLKFATTEKLPTYLVALAVGELDVVTAPPIPPSRYRKRPLPLRGVAARGKGKDLEYALATTGALLAPLEDYFAQPYPYSKLDLIAVPDFQSGAMENAGAVTFRERLLLLRPDAPVTQRQAYASVMAHELAHMWFGNLVTMPWWDDIWLNESFATWMSYKAVRDFDPGARPELRRLARLRYAKREDTLASARQIREPVKNHHDIVSAFDSITYAKGGAVLNMLEHHLGEDRFRAAVRDHMTRFAWGSADVNDFIASLVSGSEAIVEPSFESFLFQKGLPRVSLDTPCQDGRITLRQSHFTPIGVAPDDTRRWIFPVCLRYGQGDAVNTRCEWLAENTGSLTFDGEVCPDWLMLDADYSGYYHWQMPASAYAQLDVGEATLSDVEWESVADSLSAALVDGALSPAEAWPVLAPLAASPYPSVALAPARVIELWMERYGDEPKLAAGLRQAAASLYAHHDAVRAFDRAFVSALADDEQRLFHERLSRFVALVARDARVRNAALERVSEALTDGGLNWAALEPLTLGTVLTVAVQDGDASVRQRILDEFLGSNDSQFRADALKALGAARDAKFAGSLRDRAMAGALRANEIGPLFRAQLNEPNARNDAWRFVRDRYADLVARMPPRHTARLPRSFAVFCDAGMAKPIAAVFEPYADDVPGGRRELNKALESLNNCSARSAVERSGVRAAFAPGVRR